MIYYSSRAYYHLLGLLLNYYRNIPGSSVSETARRSQGQETIYFMGSDKHTNKSCLHLVKFDTADLLKISVSPFK